MKNISKRSLKEIALEANVSPALVSLILNGKGRASDAVRKRVHALLEKNGYKPKYARAPFYFLLDLRRVEAAGKTTIVMEQLSGMQRVFDEADIALHVEFLMLHKNHNSANVLPQLKRISQRKPSGVLINTDSPFLEQACAVFTEQKIPFVQLGYDTELPSYNAVVNDSFSGAYLATSHLLQKGHRKIAIIRWTGGTARVNSNKKFAGYQTALADAGIEIVNDYIKILSATEIDASWQPARNLYNELLELSSPPTALFVDNSFISLSLLYPLEQDRGKLPESLNQLEMIHYEDWSLDPVHDILSKKLFYPHLQSTLVTIDWEVIGRTAAQLLINQITNKTQANQIIKVSPGLCKVHGNNRTLIEKSYH